MFSWVRVAWERRLSTAWERRLLAGFLTTLFSLTPAFAQPKEHSFEHAVQQYEQEARIAVEQALKKRAICFTQFEVQIDPNGTVVAMNIDETTCNNNEQKKLVKQIPKIIFPRFKDIFLHHSHGKLPVIMVKLNPPDAQPGETVRVQCLWGAL